MRERMHTADLVDVFAAWRATFAAQRDSLIALDGKVGDSDLGITMNKAFGAASDAAAAAATEPPAKLLQRAGMAIAKAAPSTMGTLTATGFMRGAKALAEAPDNGAGAGLGTTEWALFWTAYHQGVAERGKARPGDKTVLDVLGPLAASLQTSAAAGIALPEALAQATQAAVLALEATKGMVAQHGKAACFQEKSLGLQDAGGTVAWLLIDTLHLVSATPPATPPTTPHV